MRSTRANRHSKTFFPNERASLPLICDVPKVRTKPHCAVCSSIRGLRNVGELTVCIGCLKASQHVDCPHGSLGRYFDGCRCDECRERMAVENRKNYQRKQVSS